MKQSQKTKRSLLISTLVFTICVALLIGTTMAWFTDSAATNKSIIQSGTLKVDLLVKAKGDTDFVSVKDDPTKALFDYDLWEPGYTEFGYAKVKNDGTLALKYKFNLVATGTATELADVIDVYFTDSEITARTDITDAMKVGTLTEVLADPSIIGTASEGWLRAGEEAATASTIILKMQETAGNQYQGMDLGANFYLQVLATQKDFEEDSFDNTYDAQAPFIEVPAANIAPYTMTAADITAAGVTPDTALEFKSYQTPDDITGKDYKDWETDFYLSFNQDVDKSKVFLTGNYGTYGWLGDTLGTGTLAAGEEIRVVETAIGAPVTYNDVVTLVKDSKCAIKVTDPAAGLEVSLVLRMTEPSGNIHDIAVYNYAF